MSLFCLLIIYLFMLIIIVNFEDKMIIKSMFISRFEYDEIRFVVLENCLQLLIMSKYCFLLNCIVVCIGVLLHFC